MSIDPNMAVDLGKRAELNKLAEENASKMALITAEAEVVMWERAMNRTFKGIVDGATRRRMMVQAADRYEREQA